jgi:hypothetical protein
MENPASIFFVCPANFINSFSDQLRKGLVGKRTPTGFGGHICGLPAIDGRAHIAGNQVASPAERQNLWNP